MCDLEPNMPEWLTKEFLEKVLNNEYASELEINITDYKVENFVSKGNNYTSTMLRINIEYNIVSNGAESSEKTSLIAKVPILEGPVGPIAQKVTAETEVNAYKGMLPKINEIMKNENAEDDFISKMFKTDVEQLMILEDLNASGYSMADRKQQLDYDHGVLTIKCLAKFHAASVRVLEREPELLEQFKTDIVFSTDEDVRGVINSMIGEGQLQVIIQEFGRWLETRKYVDFLTKLKRKFWDVYLGAIAPSDGEFTVFNHGDLWTNNMLFKYNHNGKPQTLKFVDFQLVRCTSPTVDLLNFLHSSIRFDVLNKHFNNFVQIYFDDLNLALGKYGCTKRLEEAEFKKSLEKREIFCILLPVVVLPYVLAGSDELDEKDESPNTFPNVRLVQNEMYRTVCTKYLDEFSKRDSFKNFE